MKGDGLVLLRWTADGEGPMSSGSAVWSRQDRSLRHGLTRPRPPHGCSPRWAYLAGFRAEGLGGAQNTPGQPLAVYGALRQWPKDEFRAGPQTLFLLSGTLTAISHTLANHLTLTVLRLYAWTPCGPLLGTLTGVRVDRDVHRERCRIPLPIVILLLALSLPAVPRCPPCPMSLGLIQSRAEEGRVYWLVRWEAPPRRMRWAKRCV